MKTYSFVMAISLAAFLGIVPRANTGLDAPDQQQSDRLLGHGKEPGKQVLARRMALVIGNSAYQNANRLANPANDAQDMAATLSELGFELVGGGAHVNQNADQMKRLILEFGDKLSGSGGVGLFYYAGHGVQSQGHNYLIPVEAAILREKALEFDTVDVNRVLSEMDAADNRFNIVILDACRSNPFIRSWRDSSQGLAQVNAPEGTLIAYATSPGKVASDGKGRNGTYTAALLKQMRMPGVAIEQMLKAVRAAVKAATNGEQTPWEATSLVGQFCFVGDCAKGLSNEVAKHPRPDSASNTRRKTQDTLPLDRRSEEATIHPGPVNLALSKGVYAIKDEKGQANQIQFTAKAINFNVNSDINNEVAKSTDAASHVWDNKWYSLTLPKETMLLLAWRNLTKSTQGWALVQRSSLAWIYKTNDADWKPLVTGQTTNCHWAFGGNKFSISIEIPAQAHPWTADDVKYKFGF